ncbi:Planctomycete cytochrome C [Stieleria maiorica]|uniref:Planctomycete cytochrome C n=1 Tax=Stieleria maiorica TaxID=2795974 RepID=A0A5B9MKH6_9BACT|nr:PSD1 and planctomycete cytochrome C domain-containing protein [Stieleria maiorica]QEG00970.1 Planctomycete cytochrome C [Stieleria maiorica]
MLIRIFVATVFLMLVGSSVLWGESPADPAPDFARDVRPILSDHCFACHGPDQHERQADLRLDTADGVASVIEAGAVDDSELIARLRSDDADMLMPPPEYNKPLSESQKQTLEAWVAAGAEFRGHWAFESPVKADVPPAATHPIDHFIDTKAIDKGLTLAGVADEAALLRRLCLDLTGLPPSRQQIEQLAEGKLDVDRLIDELLASPAFGQHFGRYWLDLVRYADTHGLHLDNYREMWPYRDWVIDAFNQNMPFDQFITEQLAGDLLPDATLSQKIASGFNRLNVTTNEGGSIYDEVFARNVIDRTDAFGTVFLGMTTQCAVCHDHKFDPISQQEYYSLFAFFNSLDGRALDENKKDPAPVIRVPNQDQSAELAALDEQIHELRREMRGPIDSVDQAQRDWEAGLAAQHDSEASKDSDRTELLTPSGVHAKFGTDLIIESDGSVRVGETIADREVQTITATLPQELADGGWQTLQLEVLPDPKTDRAGVAPNGNAVLTEIEVETRVGSPVAEKGWESLPIRSAVADVEQQDGSFAISFAIDGKQMAAEGWAVAGHQQTGGRNAAFAVAGLDERIDLGHDQIRVRLMYLSQFAKHQLYAVRLSLSESPAAAPIKDQITIGDLHAVGPFPVESSNPGIYRSFGSQQGAFKADETFKYEDKTYSWEKQDDWTPVAIHSLPVSGESVAVNLIHQSLTSPKKQSIDLLLGTSDSHVVFLNGKRVALSERTGPINPLGRTYSLELKKGHNDLYIKTVSLGRDPQFAYAYRSPAIPLPDSIASLAAQQPSDRTDQQAASLRTYYREVQCTHPDWTVLQDMVKGAEAAKEKLEGEIATTLVWKELDQPREAKILIRGQYDQPGETVDRQVPEFLPPMADDLPRDRLGLARWLVAPEHPLTARVAVNRFWQSIFGSGLVKSSEDFGSQGQPPSHPELLDWLAVDFIQHGWDVKRLIKLMVTSDAYRRDAVVDPKNLAIDPENRYLARGPRHRLDAEVLRDQALSLAGLLNPQSGGPSVKPPQPSGLWYAVGYTRSNTANFKADAELEKQLRRSVYIFWKRTSAPPQMSTFDAPSRESCTARRERTNTPLQALLLMNEYQYLQAAKHLAVRPHDECDSDDASDKLAWLFETVTARRPVETEVDELVTLLDKVRKHYADDPAAAKDLLSVDDIQIDALAPSEHAAWMMIASTLLNLDQVVNK